MSKQKFTNAKDFLNQIVTVKINRPLNSKHDKFDMIYEANYGFIPDTIAPDEEELDAYVLGVNKPLEKFIGKCIAIIHRTNDEDDKLIVVPEEFEISDEEIQKQTHFQEKWFKSVIIRK
jgi:inorganic pyrophosphatase